MRLNKKNFEDEELPHELFLATRQTAKIRNKFANKMSTDVKLIKAQVSKKIQSDGSFSSWLGNLGKKVLTEVPIPLATDNLPGLVSNIALNAINKFERKLSGKGAVRLGKGFTLFISNEDMNDIIKIVKLFKDSGVVTESINETVKHEIKKQGRKLLGALLAHLVTSLVQPVIFSVVRGINRTGVRRAGRGYMYKYF